MKITTLCLLLLAAGVPTIKAVAQDAPVSNTASAAPTTNAEYGVPVFPYDITDRPYRVLGEVKAGVRKATVFSKAPSQEKIYRELWERGQKLGADAVVKAQYGDSHVSAMSWGKTNATGTAIKFLAPGETASTPPTEQTVPLSN